MQSRHSLWRVARPALSLFLSLSVALSPLVYAAEPQVGEETIYFLLEDHLGSVTHVLDEDGNAVEQRDYLPYGGERSHIRELDEKESYGFTGKELDDETNLQYFEARYYDPGIGRFISRDNWEGDLKNPQTLNPYSYALNNPLNYIDPTGNVVESLWDAANVAYDGGRMAISGIGTMFGAGKYVISAFTGSAEGKAQAQQIIESNVSTFKQASSDLAFDAAATAIPFVPAGMTKISRVTKNTEKLSDVVQGIPQSALDRVKKRILGLTDRKYKTGDVKAFGSRTTGKNRPDSDVDIYFEINTMEVKDNPRFNRILDSIRKDFKEETGHILDLKYQKRENVGAKTKYSKENMKDF